ncbi:hypothetical protein IC614_09885 [Allosphingosinicella flava]|uniref:Glycosyltransferase RgtA/B/C/D-like domain-containing protein n=1 Tax=Allosphingosinicella flava TaxID=2771430 RepID=A0A7T2GJ09_9SPHN|nr:hypothetical protein IC614_09885 [Sphingosinicella flava]
MTDLPGHMGRYHVQMELPHSATLARYYTFDWSLIGNLGVDLLIVPLSHIFGNELASKSIILSIPVLTAVGLLWVAHEVHGEIPPTAFFALPFAFNFPFAFGFVNFALSMGLGLLAFALWLRLARLGRLKLRAALFVPLSIVIWVTHTFGWGTLGVMAFSAELVRQWDMRRGFFRAGWTAGLHCLSLAPPILLMLLWRSGEHVTGQTADWFNWTLKWRWVEMALRDRWYYFDVGALVVVALLLVIAVFHRRLTYSRNLLASAIFLSLVYILLPRIVFGSNYADMRLVPYVMAVATLAVRFRQGASRRLATLLAVMGLSFFGARTIGSTISFALFDKEYDRNLAALDHLPHDARLVSFVGTTCVKPWAMSRLEHLPGIALVRRNAFSNDQWSMPGAQLLQATYPDGVGFRRDPSQQVVSRRCRFEQWRTMNEALAQFPRRAFDYVWLINPPPYDPALTRGLQPIWRNGSSVLYRVADRTPPGASPKEGQ